MLISLPIKQNFRLLFYKNIFLMSIEKNYIVCLFINKKIVIIIYVRFE